MPRRYRHGQIAATARPPSAGPRARARLNPALLSETASGNCSRGTSSGTIACQAGLFIAVPIFSRKVRISSTHGEMMLKKVSTLRIATARQHPCLPENQQPAAIEDIGRRPRQQPSTTTGRLAAVCIRAISKRRRRQHRHQPGARGILHPAAQVGTMEASHRSAENRHAKRLKAVELCFLLQLICLRGRHWAKRGQSGADPCLNYPRVPPAR